MPRIFPSGAGEEDAQQHASSAHTVEQAATGAAQKHNPPGDANERDSAAINALEADDSYGKGQAMPLLTPSGSRVVSNMDALRIHHEGSMIDVNKRLTASLFGMATGDPDRITLLVGPLIFHPYSAYRLAWDLWGMYACAVGRSWSHACIHARSFSHTTRPCVSFPAAHNRPRNIYI
jgi:hypothetical protein